VILFPEVFVLTTVFILLSIYAPLFFTSSRADVVVTTGHADHPVFTDVQVGLGVLDTLTVPPLSVTVESALFTLSAQ